VAPPDELQAIQNLRDLITGATTYAPTAEHAPKDESTNFHNNITSNSDPVPGPVHITPVPSPIHVSPDPLQTALPPRIEHTRPHVIPFHDKEYDPPPHLVPCYNLRPHEHTILSAIMCIGEAHTRGILVSAVINEPTGDSLEYRQLIKHPKYKEIWSKSYANELGRLTNGIRDKPGTNTMTYIRKSEILKDRLKHIAFSKIVVIE
jgi:hypothetical protein